VWKRWLPIGIIALLVVLFFGGRAYVVWANQTHPDPWPMLGGSAGLRYATRATLPRDAQVLWSYPLEPNSFTPPLIDEAGAVYLSSGDNLLVIGPDGKRRWSWDAPEGIWSTALSRHGSLYVLGHESLFAFDRKGRLEWKAELPAQPNSRLVVGQGGNLYYCSAGELHALTSEGKPLWHKETGNGVNTCPVETASGLVLVAGQRDLTAFRPGGEVEWRRTLGRPFTRGQGLAADNRGRIYMRTANAFLVLNEEGEVQVDRSGQGSPAWNLAVGESVVQEGRARRDSKGALLWELPPSAFITSHFSLVDTEGKLLMVKHVAGGQNTLVLLDSEGATLWVSPDGLNLLTEPAVSGRGDFCFVASQSGPEPIALICMGEPASE